MNITITQLQAIRSLISKDDKLNIGMHTNKSHRTVEAVLQGDRANDEIERYTVLTAKQNLAFLSNILADIEAKNLSEVSIENFTKFRNSSIWVNDNAYKYYIDTYLQLSQFNFKEPEELWDILWKDHKGIIPYSYYCIDLTIRLLGVSSDVSVNFYNKKIQDI